MPATNYTPILLYRTATASTTAPAAGNLNFGELAINYNASGMILYAKNASGSVIKLMNNPANLLYPTADGSPNQAIVTNGSGTLSFASVTTSPGGSNTQIQYNNSGAFGGSSNLTWDGTNFKTAGNARIEGTGIGITGTGVGAEIFASSGNVYYQAYNRTTSAYAPVIISGSEVIFTTAGFERMRIDSSGNVGIGTSSPSQELEVRKDQGSGTLVKVTNKTNNNSAVAGVLFENSTSNNASLALWDSGTIAGTVYSDSYGFYLVHSGGPIGIVADNASGVIKFATGGTTERMRIDSSGNVLVGKTSLSDSTAGIQLRTQGVYVVGCTSSGSEALMLNRNTSDGTIAIIKRGNTEVGTISVTGSATAYNTASPSADGAQLNYQGITFRATQSASSNANTLDDYEEGTWTVSLAVSSASSGPTISSAPATYTKIGRLVHITCEISYSGVTMSGVLQITGLPFSAASTPSSSLSVGLIQYWTEATPFPPLTAYANGTRIYMTRLTNAAYGSDQFPTDDNGGTILIGGCYYV